MARTHARGFTMIEILLVLALSFVALLGTLSLQVVAVRANSQSRAITEATGLAQDRLEMLRHRPLVALVPSLEPQLDATGQPVPGGAYSRRVTITPLPNGTAVSVQVTWRDAGGAPHAVTVSTVRAP